MVLAWDLLFLMEDEGLTDERLSHLSIDKPRLDVRPMSNGWRSREDAARLKVKDLVLMSKKSEEVKFALRSKEV
jgi:hypothetical protein